MSKKKVIQKCWVDNRVARCPVFNLTVRYFGFLSGRKMIAIPDNAL